jgi:hypothetical protein
MEAEPEKSGLGFFICKAAHVSGFFCFQQKIPVMR